MTSRNAVARLIGDIYDAALEPARWGALLGALVEVTDAEAGQLIAYAPGSAGRIVLSANFEPVEARRYDNHYSRLDPVGPLLAQRPLGELFVCRDMVSRHQADGEFYCDWAAPNRMGDAIFLNLGREREGVDLVRRPRAHVRILPTQEPVDVPCPQPRDGGHGSAPFGVGLARPADDGGPTPHGLAPRRP